MVSPMELIRIELDEQRIAHLVLDHPQSPVNTIDLQFGEQFHQAVLKLTELDCRGVILRSNKTTFMAGGDLALLSQVNDKNAIQVENLLNQLKTDFRTLETLGIPVVALLSGSALGGGFEVALASHHRIAVNHNSIKIGLPEVTLGLLPGAGGTCRLVRLLGLEIAVPLLTEGKLMGVAQGHKLGLLHQLVDTEAELIPAAVTFIQNHDNVKSPWDQKGYKIPGSPIHSSHTQQMLSIAPAMIKKKTQGCLPAPMAVLAAAVEGATMDIEAAGRIESRYFIQLAKGQVSKNLINTLFFQKNQIEHGRFRPTENAPEPISKVGILGAGMMGAGIAWSCAKVGIDVVLLDVDQEKAEQGKTYSEGLIAKRQKRGIPVAGEEILGRIHPTTNYQELSKCDLVIEAVFENREVKKAVTQAAEAVLPEGTLIASNTSTLPITSLATTVKHPANFVGIHFFSPVDKMPLVEIISGEETRDDSLTRAFDFVRQIGKTPILVNDGRGFYTSRVFQRYVYEGLALLEEGVTAAEIENAAWAAGFPVGPLAVTDEVTLSLIEHIRQQTLADQQTDPSIATDQPGDAVLDKMISLGRIGKAKGEGFYDYPAPKSKKLWPDLATHFQSQPEALPLSTIQDRLLYSQALETVRILDEDVLQSTAEANLGSIMGIGFPVWTGGTLQFINQTGLSEFVSRAEELQSQFGERFAVPESLQNRAEQQANY